MEKLTDYIIVGFVAKKRDQRKKQLFGFFSYYLPHIMFFRVGPAGKKNIRDSVL